MHPMQYLKCAPPSGFWPHPCCYILATGLLKLGLHVNLVTRGNEAAAAGVPFALHAREARYS